MSLTDKKCVPCEGGIPKLNEYEIQNMMRKIDGNWQVIDSYKISKDFNFKNFKKNSGNLIATKGLIEY